MLAASPLLSVVTRREPSDGSADYNAHFLDVSDIRYQRRLLINETSDSLSFQYHRHTVFTVYKYFFLTYIA